MQPQRTCPGRGLDRAIGFVPLPPSPPPPPPAVWADWTPPTDPPCGRHSPAAAQTQEAKTTVLRGGPRRCDAVGADREQNPAARKPRQSIHAAPVAGRLVWGRCVGCCMPRWQLPGHVRVLSTCRPHGQTCVSIAGHNIVVNVLTDTVDHTVGTVPLPWQLTTGLHTGRPWQSGRECGCSAGVYRRARWSQRRCPARSRWWTGGAGGLGGSNRDDASHWVQRVVAAAVVLHAVR